MRRLDPVGRDHHVSEPDQVHHEFGADGNFAAKVDCATMWPGNTRPSRPVASITPGLSTLAACPPGSQADVYVAALSGATNYGVTDGNLVLTANGGTMTFS